jgi:hypothetical protein
MKISTFGEFKTFLINNGLEIKSVEIADFIGCVNSFSLICSCKKNMKSKKLEECNNKYVDIINNLSNEVKVDFFKTTTDNAIEFLYNHNFKINDILRD